MEISAPVKDIKDSLLSETLANAQIAVIGSLLLDPKIAGAAFAKVRAEDFVTPMYRTLFEGCRKIYFESRPIDPVLLLDKVGGEYQKTILNLMELTPTAANWEAYAEVLHSNATVYRAKEIAQRIVNEPILDLPDLQKEISLFNDLMCELPGIKKFTLQQLYTDVFMRHSEGKRPEYIQWGFPKLNQELFTELGDFVILGGHTSTGKTALALQMGLHIARKHRVGFLSLETGEKKAGDRVVSLGERISFTRLKKFELEEPDFQVISRRIPELEDIDFTFVPCSGVTTQDIEAITLSEGFKVLFVDYLQIITPSNMQNSQEQIARISMDLHILAQRHRILVVALSQFSRPEKSERTKAPTAQSLKGSGQLEQDADTIMLLYLSDASDRSSPRTLKIAKSKEGLLGHITLGFDGDHQRFFETTERPVLKRFKTLPDDDDIPEQFRSPKVPDEVQMRISMND